ncbi:hypothetical protein CFC21_052131 [Triticum aestivum]|uniref:Uncharacterized protein n=3 Tax=Triticum TaxID=4564 RepID=A0A9R0VZ28_TRITD|nr:hypothetical protein CFC21_052131 [Triticum aestivum]VAH90653.1 unnamed protein product [Triticum turgidum subsp. durum]
MATAIAEASAGATSSDSSSAVAGIQHRRAAAAQSKAAAASKEQREQQLRKGQQWALGAVAVARVRTVADWRAGAHGEELGLPSMAPNTVGVTYGAELSGKGGDPEEGLTERPQTSSGRPGTVGMERTEEEMTAAVARRRLRSRTYGPPWLDLVPGMDEDGHAGPPRLVPECQRQRWPR